MFSIYIAAAEELRDDLIQVAKSVENGFLLGTSDNLREALSACSVDTPGILLLDDAVLHANLALAPRVARVTYPVILVVHGESRETARRALNIRARDLVDAAHVAQDLPDMLLRHAEHVVAEEGSREGRVITVFSSKGGVGKTTVAVNLAMALAQASRRPVALVDLDLQFGDAAALLGDLPPTTLHDLTQTAVVDQLTLDRVMSTVGSTGLRVLAAPPAPQMAEDVSGELVVRVLGLLRETYGYVVVDTAPGFSDVNVGALDLADDILTLITPEIITIRTIKQALELFWNGFRYAPEKVKLIMNRAGTRTGIESIDVEHVLNVPLHFELPSDGAWPVKAANQGEALLTFQPESLLVRALKQMARRIIEENEGKSRSVISRTQAMRAPSLFRRMGFGKGHA